MACCFAGDRREGSNVTRQGARTTNIPPPEPIRIERRIIDVEKESAPSVDVQVHVERDEYGRTIAHDAAQTGNIRLLRELNARGVDLNVTDNEGVTLAHLAAENNQWATLEVLAALKVDLSRKDVCAQTAAHYACWQGHKEVVKALNRIGVKLDSRDEERKTPCHYAARQGHCGVLRTLHQIKPELFFNKDIDSHLPLFYATGAAASMFRVFSKSESCHSLEDQSPLKSPLKTRCRETDSASRDNSPIAVRNVPRHLQRSRSASSNGISSPIRGVRFSSSSDRYQSPQQSSRRASPFEGRTSSPLSGSSFTRTRTDPRSHQQYATQSLPLTALNDSRQPTYNEPSRSASVNSAKHLPPLKECERYDEEGKPTVAESTYSVKHEDEAFSETPSHVVFANRKWDSSKPRRAQPHQRAMTDERRSSGSPRRKMSDEKPGVKYRKEENLEGEICIS